MTLIQKQIVRQIGMLCSLFLLMIGVPSVTALTFHGGAYSNISSWMHTADASVTIRVYDESSKTIDPMPLNMYILEVLSAEFSPNTPEAALEAAAVATRTYAIHAIQATDAGTFTPMNFAESSLTETDGPMASTANRLQDGADVTNSPVLDLPLETEQTLEKVHPNTAAQEISQIQTAIEATDGLILTSDHAPILAFMFPISPGKTRSALDAFGRNISYLQSVVCPDDTKSALDKRVESFTTAQMAADLGVSNGKAFHLSQLRISSVSKEGFPKAVTDGKIVWTAADFAHLLKLPSSDFHWVLQGSTCIMTTYGQGNDVGMSLHEATAMASRGRTWTTILNTFYPGTQIDLDAGYIPLDS